MVEKERDPGAALSLGDPPPGRRAIDHNTPWKPTYDDGPVVSKPRDDRRFSEKPELNPSAVRSLPKDHAALVGDRTLFPSTVVDVTESFAGRLLVSGKNNRKLGERVLTGKFRGFALYGLSLEERATCPRDCDARAFCYGNGMQMARRHRIVDLDVFNRFLEHDVATILAGGVDGLLVRLHVLGDFPSVEYVAMWSDLLAEYPKLACYGYTHRRITADSGDEVGDAVAALKQQYPDRFRIRWSDAKSQPDGAVIVDYIPGDSRLREGLVCPAQTDDTACCASCGLCWEGHARRDAIVFVKHGPKSLEAAAEHAKTAAPLPATAAAPAVEGVRPIAALKIPHKRAAVLSEPPQPRVVDPKTLNVEASYQRDLSAKSIRLIKKIVLGWDWAKFKPPVVAETPAGLFVVDGQHTAIAAASHPEIEAIPVMVVRAELMERRADAFVSHNRDRLTMTPAQIFYGDVAKGDARAAAVLDAVKRAGGEIPRLPVNKRYAKPGQITAVGELRGIQASPGGGAALVERVVRIAVLARTAPITLTVAKALRTLLTEPPFRAASGRSDADIAAALAGVKNIEAVSQHYAAETGQSRFRAAAMLVAAKLERPDDGPAAA